MAVILIVDDVAVFRELTSTALRRSGHTVVTACNGREALQTMETGPQPDLVVLDVAMPVMSGLELLQVIRSTPQWRHLPVVVVTASGRTNELRQAMALGAGRFMFKSLFSPDDLLTAIEAELQTAEPV